MFMTWSTKDGSVSPPSDSPDQSPLKTSKPKLRSRSGCNTCRRRRIKCDEGHPVCTRCQRSKNKCSYELRLQWEDEMRTAGKCHGRTGVQPRRDSLHRIAAAGDGDPGRLTRASSGNETHQQHGDGDSDALPIASPPSRPASHSPPPPVGYHLRYLTWKKVMPVSRTIPVLPWSVGVPDVDDVCLSFYESVMCAIGVTVDDERYNPLRSTVMRLVFRSETAYFAVLMAGAHYLRSFESRFDVMEMQIRQRVLGGLRQALMKSVWSWEDVLVPTIFLCSSAISNSCDASWVKHLTCFQLIVKEMAQGGRKTPPVPPFFISYFTLHLVLAKSLFAIEDVLPVVEVSTRRDSHTRTLSIESGRSSWTSTKDLSRVMSDDNIYDIDIWTGLSGHLLLLINDILSLKHDAQALYHLQLSPFTKATADQKRSAIDFKIATLQGKLATATQKIPISLHRATDSPDSAGRCRLLEGTGEAYRLAACLLLSESTTASFLGYTPVANSIPRENNIDRILELASQVISSLDFLPISWPLWPLFIAACCCLPGQENQKTAAALFKAAREKAPYENIPRAHKVVELLWQRRELHVEDETSGKVGRFEWEPVMEFLGWQTSFA